MNAEDTKWLEAAFTDRALEDEDKTVHRFYKKVLGLLSIPTGDIVACDPVVLSEDTPINTRFPIGKFPVELAVIQIEDVEEDPEPDERVAFARIVFSEQPVSYWKLAVWEDMDTNDLEDDDFIGYSVDVGTGSFMDKLALQKLKVICDNDETGFDAILEEMDLSYKDTRSWLLKDLGDGLNMAVFSSGYGDGLYPTYIGYDKARRIARLTTDFGCLWEPIDDETEQ